MLKFILAASWLFYIAFAHPVSDSATESLIVVNKNASNTNQESQKNLIPPQLKSMHVTSNVRNRYARTVVTSKYANLERIAQQATFSIVLPDTAFIAGFVMEIEGKKYEAYVKEKEEAKKEYQQAVAQGLGAAHVAVSARDSNKFTVSVNVEPQSKVIFNLTYEELLVRKHGKYEMVVNLHPGQLVKDLGVVVNINETRPIINVDTPALRSGNEISNTINKNKYATINKGSDGVFHISFNPTVEQQRQMAKSLLKDSEKNDEDKGISGQFVIEYDVERDPNGGEVLVNDGYFVHFFAPSDLKPIPKHVIFILDVSGSMYGRKIEQLRQAMKVILGELSTDDYISLVKFHSTVHVLNSQYSWEHILNPVESELPPGFRATKENIENIQKIVKRMTDESLTNIYDALVVGLRMASKGISNIKETDSQHNPQPIIVFLTDGEANIGESRPDKIIEMVEKRNTNAALFALAFGNDANDEFLKELAIKNSAFSRKIYEASDASLQLQDFYKQISSPLLTNVNFKYSEEQIKNVTKHSFPILFKGSEFVVAGKINKEVDKFITVECSTFDGINDFYPTIVPITTNPEIKEGYGSLERLWAYLTIKQLLEKKYEKTDKNITVEETPEKQALNLALKYSFVTPVTSLVVVKPNETVSTTGVQEIEERVEDDVNSGSPISLRSGVYHLLPMPALNYDDDMDSDYLPAPVFSMEPLESEDITVVLSTILPDLTTNQTNHNDSDIITPVWLKNIINSSDYITIHNKEYKIGNNETLVEYKPCQVESLNISGNCTLLNACSNVYPNLDSLQTYETIYFCSLESDRYAGVCCPLLSTAEFSKR